MRKKTIAEMPAHFLHMPCAHSIHCEMKHRKNHAKSNLKRRKRRHAKEKEATTSKISTTKMHHQQKMKQNPYLMREKLLENGARTYADKGCSEVAMRY